MKKIFLLFILYSVILSCTRISGSNEIYEGKWTSLGGNWVLEIESNGDYTEYDYTSISCQIARVANIQEFGNRISLSNDTLKIKRGVMEYGYIRTNQDYRLCDSGLTQEQKNDPLFNFEVFSATILENYAFMELNEVDWVSLYNTSKERITTNPNNQTLFEVINEMLNELKDNHGYLEPSSDIIDQTYNENSPTDEIGDFYVSNMVSENHLIEEYTKGSNIVRWGKMNDSIGYIQVKAMYLFSYLGITQEEINDLGYQQAYDNRYYALNEGEYIELERIAMNKTMEKVFEDLSNFKSIVIDIRFNGGGQDAVSLELLSWLNDSPKLMAHPSLFYNDKEFPTWDITIESKEKHFTGDVYLLTSQQTGSAAEIFALGSMTLPSVRRIGMPTMGALSTALEKELPNGWKFALSNERYRNLEGEYFENRGIPVEYEIDYPEDRQEFFKSVLDNIELDEVQILQAISELKKIIGED